MSAAGSSTAPSGSSSVAEVQRRVPSNSQDLPRSHVRITREGWGWLIFTTFLWATGLYKGINLFTFLGVLLASTWLVQLLFAGRRLRYLDVQRRIRGWAFAQTPFTFTVCLNNPTRRTQSGLTVEDRGLGHFWSWFVLRLGAHARLEFQAEMLLRKRGLYDWPPIAIRSGFPLGLVERRVHRRSGDELVVFPRLGRLHRGRLRRLLKASSLSPGRARVHPRRHPAAQSDFHGLRAFRSGDSPHWIHWRTSARRGELMVREFEETPNDNLILVLDPWVPPDAKESPLLEDAISLAATICWEWIRPSGDRFVLAVAGKDPQIIQGVTGQDLGARLLRALAGVAGSRETDSERLVDSLRPILPPGPILLVSTRSGDLKTLLERELHRPVTFVNVAELSRYDFFEWESLNSGSKVESCHATL